MVMRRMPCRQGQAVSSMKCGPHTGCLAMQSCLRTGGAQPQALGIRQLLDVSCLIQSVLQAGLDLATGPSRPTCLTCLTCTQGQAPASSRSRCSLGGCSA